LRLREWPVPGPGAGQCLVRVSACAVCRTDLHVVEGELPSPKLPLVPGHEIVGRVAAVGAGVEHLQVGGRVGVPWLDWTCGECGFCRSAREKLCDAMARNSSAWHSASLSVPRPIRSASRQPTKL
jgi:alcohol dehydrogenase, propanol-preferring